MPATSKAQQSVAGMALAAKRGQIPVERLKGAALKMYHSMTEAQLVEFAGTGRKALPKKKSKPKNRMERGEMFKALAGART